MGTRVEGREEEVEDLEAIGELGDSRLDRDGEGIAESRFQLDAINKLTSGRPLKERS